MEPNSVSGCWCLWDIEVDIDHTLFAGIAFRDIDRKDEGKPVRLYPCVGLRTPHEEVEANFGQVLSLIVMKCVARLIHVGWFPGTFRVRY